MMQGQTAEKLIVWLKLEEFIPIITTGFKVTIGELHRFGNTSSSGGQDNGADVFYIFFVIIGNN
jgi:hypothetical protein